MAKFMYSVYLETSDYERLKVIAGNFGYFGRGAISRFLQKLSQEEFIFLDENFRKGISYFIKHNTRK